MITLHKANDRGHTDLGWLDSRHTFSFGEYHDSKMMGFRTLRVINDDRVAAGQGFGTHPHRDMEIISYALKGALEHKDSLGNGSQINAGEIQRMSAGSGITHSEFNPSKEDSAHFLQIWIKPDKKGIEPEYEQKPTGLESSHDEWKLLVSGKNEDGLLKIHRDARIWGGKFSTDKQISFNIENNRAGWLHVIDGNIQIGEYTLHEGDALQIEDENSIKINVIKNAHLLLFDMS